MEIGSNEICPYFMRCLNQIFVGYTFDLDIHRKAKTGKLIRLADLHVDVDLCMLNSTLFPTMTSHKL